MEALAEQASSGPQAVLADYRGLTVKDHDRTAQADAGGGGEFKVVKNTLARLAAEQAQVEAPKALEGPTALAFGYDDPVAPAKILTRSAAARSNRRSRAGCWTGPVDRRGV